MSNTMTKHFAVIRDNSSRYNRDMICQVDELQPNHEFDEKLYTYSRCGKFRYWEPWRIFVSEVKTISIEIIEDPEREIDACNKLIFCLNAQAHERLEHALEPVRARKTELMQISYQPTQPEVPEHYEEVADISKEAFDLLDNGEEINERT